MTGVQTCALPIYTENLVAGQAGKPPILVDGKGKQAGFMVPRALEMDASGTFHFVDGSDQTHVRTISRDYEVKTLSLDTIKNRIMALDSDVNGNIHVLEKKSEHSYIWHRLADGTSTIVDLGNMAAGLNRFLLWQYGYYRSSGCVLNVISFMYWAVG